MKYANDVLGAIVGAFITAPAVGWLVPSVEFGACIKAGVVLGSLAGATAHAFLAKAELAAAIRRFGYIWCIVVLGLFGIYKFGWMAERLPRTEGVQDSVCIMVLLLALATSLVAAALAAELAERATRKSP